MIYYTLKYKLIILYLISSVGFAQTNKHVEFKVVKPKIETSLTPDYNCLYQNLPHPISGYIMDTTHQYVTRLAGGRIIFTDTNMILIPEVVGEAILNLYQINKGVERLVFSKRYIVLPEPKVQIRGKQTDNYLHNILLVSGKLKGVTSLGSKRVILKVTSFTVEYLKDGAFKRVEVIGNSLPIPVRKEIAKLPHGSMIYYEDIKAQLLPGFNVPLQPYRISSVVIDPKEVTKFGLGNN